MQSIRSAGTALFLLSVLFLEASAQGKSGVSPGAISLPSGPGSIEGLGGSFEPQLNTGTAAYSFSILVPPGVAGHQPSISFGYDSGSGNGPLGIGWAMGLAEITRQTDKGVPRYTGAQADPASEDVFLFAGEELVPLSDGTYRCENEVQFIRFRKIAATDGGPVVAWEGTERNGNRMLFGLTAAERVTRPAGNPDSFADAYCWKISSHVDVNGNTIDYGYEPFAPESSGMLYCTQIEYARFGDDVHHRVFFLYSGSTSHPESRTDVFSDYRPGFEVRTSKLLREVRVHTDGELVRRYLFGYHPDPSIVVAGPNDVELGFNLLHEVTQYDRSGTDQNFLPPLRLAYSRFHTETIPSKEVRKIGFLSAKGVARPEFLPVAGGSNFLRFGPAQTEVVDINSDGLPDFVSSGENRWFAYLNRGGGLFSGEVLFQAGAADGKRLDEAGITLADLDGDGVTDLFQKNAAGDRFLMHRNPNDFGSPTTLDENEVVRWGAESTFSDETGSADFGSLAVSDPSLQRIDLNFDKRIDLMRPFDFGGGSGGVEYLLNLPGEDALSAVWRSQLLFSDDPRLPSDWVPDEARFDGHNPAFRRAELTDMNGDRLLDWCTLAVVGGEVWIDYWPNANGGAWANRRSMERLEIPGVFADDLLLMDVNADGLTDLVRIENNILTFWVNIGSDLWSEAIVRTDAPPFVKNQTVLRQLDVNGNGTTDLFWDNSALPGKGVSKGFTTHMFFDFVGALKPNLMRVIDNGIGVRTLVEYRSSTDHYLEAVEAGQPWTTKLSFPVDVVSRIVENIGLDLNGDGEIDEYITDFNYFNGYYDSFEKEFRGFAYAEEIVRGDDYDPRTGLTTPGPGEVHAPSLVRRHRFLTGSPDGVDNDDYPEDYLGPRMVDEGSGTGLPFTPTLIDEGGREEEVLKGNPTMVEEIDAAVLTAPEIENAGFHAGARASALAAMNDPFGPEAQRCAPDKYVYNRSISDWRIRRLYRPSTVANPPGRFAEAPIETLVGKSVSFAFTRTSDQEVFEANGFLHERLDGDPVPYPLRNRVLTRTIEDYDDYGNQTLNAEYGIVEPDSPEGLSARNDERITRTDYALGGEALDRWIVSSPSRVRVEDENGVFASEIRNHYDGDEFEGLPWGEVGSRGLLKRTVNLITEDPDLLPDLEIYDPARLDHPGDPRREAGASIVSSRVAHDFYGNVLAKLDPLADAGDVVLEPSPQAPLHASPAPQTRGHIHIVGYDPVRRVYPIEERFVVGDGSEDLTLQAEYDPGFGTVISVFDFNGHRTDYKYDSFNRLVKVIEPGDDEDRPTTHYLYRPGDSQRGLVYVYDDEGNLIGGAPQPAAPPMSNAVETRQREDVSSSIEYNTLDSIVYTSGRGQALMTVGTGEATGEWFVEQATVYNLRGSAAATYQPYLRTNPNLHAPAEGGIRHDGAAMTAMDRTDTFLDSLERPIALLNPPEKFSGERRAGVTQHLPFETRYFDEEDADPASPHFNTPSVEIEDGLARVVEAKESSRLEDDGTPSATVNEWTTRFRVDLNDKIFAVEDAQDNIRWFRHDGLGRMIFMNDCDRGTLANTYDDASNLLSRLDAKGQLTTSTYDGVNRLLTEDYHDQGLPFSAGRSYDPNQPIDGLNRPDVRYVYDEPEGPVDFGDGSNGLAANGKNNLVAVVDLAGEEHFSHDERNRQVWTIKRIPDPVHGVLTSYRTRVSYDASDRMREIVYPDGDAAVYEYNARGLLGRILGGAMVHPDGKPHIVEEIEYLPSGQTKSRRLGNGVVTRFEYDPRLRVSAMQTRRGDAPSAVEILEYEYSHDGASNIVRIDDRRSAAAKPGGDPIRNTQIFLYDDLYRLLAVDYSHAPPGEAVTVDLSERFRYDRIGNMLEKTSTHTGFDHGLPTADLGQLEYGGGSGRSGRVGRTSTDAGPHAVTTASNLGSIQYDANGNVVSIAGRTFTWDFVDRLAAVEDDEIRAEYVYDHADARVLKRIFKKNADGSIDGPPLDSAQYINPHFEVRHDGRPVKYITHEDAIIARLTGTLDAARPRVQRFRIRSGWNFLGLQVEAEDLAGQLGIGPESEFSEPHRWLSESKTFSEVAPEEGGAAGAVYALFSNSDAVVPVVGMYGGPSDRPVETGGDFVATTGLEGGPTVDTIPSAVNTAWLYHPFIDRWRTGYSGEAEPLSDLPETLGPSHPLFILAEGSTSLVPPEPEDGVHYYLPDHLGSSNVVTNGAGEVIEETAFFPFGHPRAETGSATAEMKSLGRYLFSQKELDEETGLQYFEARHLSGPLARFLSVDPVIDERGLGENPQALNPYAYSANNPVNRVDPDGRTILIQGSSNFKRDVKETLKGLAAKSPDAKKMIQGLRNDKKFNLTIAFEKKEAYFQFDRKVKNEGRIAWDPNAALEFQKRQGGDVKTYAHPPALELAHELGHADAWRKDPGAYRKRFSAETHRPFSTTRGFDDAEERRNILHVEAPIAKQLGFETRPHHRGSFYSNKGGPFSTLSKKPPPVPPRPKKTQVQSPGKQRPKGGVFKPVKPTKRTGGVWKAPPRGKGRK